MTRERWEQVKLVLDRALDHDPAERDAFLLGACGDDSALRHEIDSFLDLEREGEIWDFLDQPIFSLQPRGEDEAIGRRIGPYVLQRKLGQGGMGAVYLATRRNDFEKRVAIKLLKRGMDSDELVGRFRVERQILAQLEHPNIARLLDGGSTDDGLPYVVMEHVEGVPIDHYCRDRQLGVRQRLALFRKVCQAVHTAHQSLVVHRDLKPSNILVTADGEPKLLDFGIAKLLRDSSEAVMATETGLWLMTPEYASPEQLRGRPITTASDIYALGVLLYDLLTDGERPYQLPSRSAVEVARVVCEKTPQRPSSRVLRRQADPAAEGDTGAPAMSASQARRRHRRLRGDLDAIVLKALRKEPALRYGSAEQLSEDLWRYLEGFPVRARQGSLFYAASRFLRRNWLTAATAGIFVALLVGFGVRERFQSTKLRVERDTSESIVAFLESLFEATDPNREQGVDLTARDLLDAGADQIRGDLTTVPEVKAGLMDTIGRLYRKLGFDADALPLLEDALALRRQVFPEGHSEIAYSALHLASTLDALGRADEAEPLFVEARAIQGESRIEEDDAYVAGLNNYADFLRRRGDYQQALALFEEVLAAKRKIYGNDDLTILVTVSNVANLHREDGDYHGAKALYEEVLATRRRVQGDVHTDVANALNNLAAVLQRLGENERALALYEEALAINRKLLDSDHPQIATNLSNLAVLFHDSGRLERAEALYREALAMTRERYGDDHLRAAAFGNNLGSVLIDLGRLEEAEPLLRQALAVFRDQFPAGHQHVAIALRNLAWLTLQRGDADQALALAQEAVDLFARTVPDHWRLADARSVLGSCLAAAGGDPGEALTMLEDGVDTLSQALGPDARQTREAAARYRALAGVQPREVPRG